MFCQSIPLKDAGCLFKLNRLSEYHDSEVKNFCTSKNVCIFHFHDHINVPNSLS